MRHAILSKHKGERFAPAQLKTELLRQFPHVKPQSVNASDCHYSDRKKAGSTCPECGKLGGFAVNRDGVVDMGAEGWGSISPTYVPTGNTRENIGVRTKMPAITIKNMTDPLADFDWKTVYHRYDNKCRKFDPGSKHLAGVDQPTATDRALYYWLIQTAAVHNNQRSILDLQWYEALLYWKLYSSTPDSKITSWLRSFSVKRLDELLKKMPSNVSRDVNDILALINLIGNYQLPGMASSDALPVRTTFLHFLYPNVVPIFDQMVLKAVGAWFEGANKKLSVLHEYVPYAWTLTDKHTRQLYGFKESPIRLIDMGLWITRG